MVIGHRSSVNRSIGQWSIDACFPPDADADFEEPEPQGHDAQRTRAAAERDEHVRAADLAVAAGIPEQRPRRAAAARANAAMDALEQRGELS